MIGSLSSTSLRIPPSATITRCRIDSTCLHRRATKLARGKTKNGDCDGETIIVVNKAGAITPAISGLLVRSRCYDSYPFIRSIQALWVVPSGKKRKRCPTLNLRRNAALCQLNYENDGGEAKRHVRNRASC